MKNYIPTYEEAKQMVSENGELIFYETVTIIDGYKVSTFNYRLPLYTNFINPLKDNILADAKELRGLTYVFNTDGSIYKRYLLMKKFWNINQIPESMYNEIKEYKLLSCYNKEDGSLITFIKLPSGKVITKTKMGFDNDQTIESEKIYNTNIAIKNMVDSCLDNDIITMWEYVSFKNRIVLNYDKSNLILLRLRDNKTGDYLDIEKYRNLGFDIAEKENYTVDEFIELSKTLKDKEGCVFTLEKPDGSTIMVKQKTQDYFDRHNLLTNEINREDYVIHSIIDDNIDDIKSQLDKEKDADKILFIINIEEKVSIFLKRKTEDIKELISKFDGSKKDFALKYLSDENFGLAIDIINTNKDVYDVTKEWLKSKTNRLEKSRFFIENGFIE